MDNGDTKPPRPPPRREESQNHSYTKKVLNNMSDAPPRRKSVSKEDPSSSGSNPPVPRRDLIPQASDSNRSQSYSGRSTTAERSNRDPYGKTPNFSAIKNATGVVIPPRRKSDSKPNRPSSGPSISPTKSKPFQSSPNVPHMSQQQQHQHQSSSNIPYVPQQQQQQQQQQRSSSPRTPAPYQPSPSTTVSKPVHTSSAESGSGSIRSTSPPTIVDVTARRVSKVKDDDLNLVRRRSTISETPKSKPLPSDNDEEHGKSLYFSTASFVPKGIKNSTGENNCFLNGLVQALYHLDTFRSAFAQIEHSCAEGSACILCSLNTVFVAYEFGDEPFIPADGLRQTLSILYANEQRFQLNHMEDAAEAYEAVVSNLHFALRPDKPDLCEPFCAIHKVFGTRINENWVCCDKTFSSTYDNFIQYLPAQSIFESSQRAYMASSQVFNSNVNITAGFTDIIPFERILNLVTAPVTERVCEECKTKSPVDIVFTKSPEIAVFGMIWDANSLEEDIFVSILEVLHPIIDRSALYPLCDLSTQYMQIHSLICYYGQHYVCLYYNVEAKLWVMFDDENIKPAGENWHDLIHFMRVNKYAPLVLFYEGCSDEAAEEGRRQHILSFNQYLIKKEAHPLVTPRAPGIKQAAGSRNSLIFHPSPTVLDEMDMKSKDIAQQLLVEDLKKADTQKMQDAADAEFARRLHEEEQMRSSPSPSQNSQQSHLSQEETDAALALKLQQQHYDSINTEPAQRRYSKSITGVVDFKSAHMLSRWKPRFIVLENKTMIMYKIIKTIEPQARNDLFAGLEDRVQDLIIMDDVSKRDAKHPYVLTAKTKDRNRLVFTLSIVDPKERDRWIKGFSENGSTITKGSSEKK